MVTAHKDYQNLETVTQYVFDHHFLENIKTALQNQIKSIMPYYEMYLDDGHHMNTTIDKKFAQIIDISIKQISEINNITLTTQVGNELRNDLQKGIIALAKTEMQGLIKKISTDIITPWYQVHKSLQSLPLVRKAIAKYIIKELKPIITDSLQECIDEQKYCWEDYTERQEEKLYKTLETEYKYQKYLSTQNHQTTGVNTQVYLTSVALAWKKYQNTSYVNALRRSINQEVSKLAKQKEQSCDWIKRWILLSRNTKISDERIKQLTVYIQALSSSIENSTDITSPMRTNQNFWKRKFSSTKSSSSKNLNDKISNR